MKYTVVLMHQKDGPLTIHVDTKTAPAAVRAALAKEPKQEAQIETVAGVFIGWHINKFFGKV